MFHVAFPRGQGPAYTDLPPTLQPRAITASAPPVDHLRSAALSSLVYLLLGGAGMAFMVFPPPPVLAEARATRPERIVEFEGPASPRPIERIGPAPGGSGGSAPVAALAASGTPQPDSEEPAAGLSREGHHGDPGGAKPQAQGSTGMGGPDGGQAGAGPLIRDVSMLGLTVLHQVDPVYPEFARRARIQGSVVLLMTVDERGQPIQVQVMEGHPVFHEAAVQAARQWRFEPARMDGRPVSAAFRLTLKFSMR